MPEPRKTGAQLIAEERQRQIDQGWSPPPAMDQDLVLAAIAYAARGIHVRVRVQKQVHKGVAYLDPWPFDHRLYKGLEILRWECLVKAGALIAAELDRHFEACDARWPNRKDPNP